MGEEEGSGALYLPFLRLFCVVVFDVVEKVSLCLPKNKTSECRLYEV